VPRLAFFTLAILREGHGHPRVKGFFDRVAANFAAAEHCDGNIDRSELIPGTQTHTWGEPVAPRFFREGEHGGAPRSLSLWRSLESVFAFAYSHVHAEALTHRKEWFLPPAWPPYVAWWVADGHTPDWHEATVRLEHLHDHGSTAFAFHFKQAFGPDGRPVELDRTRVKALVQRNAGTGHEPAGHPL